MKKRLNIQSMTFLAANNYIIAFIIILILILFLPAFFDNPAFPQDAKYFVTYPSEPGVMWEQGKSYIITWSGFPGSNLSIELYIDDLLSEIIASSTPNDGEFTWTVPNNQKTSSSCLLKITSTSDPSIYAYSDHHFTIGKIKLIYPSGPDITWDKGKSYAITWSGFSDPNVTIDLYKDEQLNMTIASSIFNDGEYVWTVPENQETSSRYHIRIASSSDPSVYIEPYYYLTIKEPPPMITYPMHGVMWDQGESYTITWSGFPGSSVNIELYKDDQLNVTIATSTPNDDEYTWVVPENQATSSTYFLKITSTSEPSIYAYPDYYFTIGKIKLIFPSGPDVTWNKGKSYAITWSGFSDPNVTIELYKDNQFNTTIASSASNDGEYTWTVPKNQEISSSYTVRVTSSSDPSVYVEPVYYLTIKDPPPMITYPKGLDVMWDQGKSYQITWRDFPGSNVSIELYREDQFNVTIASSTPNDGEYIWTVPNDQAISSKYSIKIASASDPSIFATSLIKFFINVTSNIPLGLPGLPVSGTYDIYFTIGKIKVTYPSGVGIVWNRGKDYTITWNGFPGPYVNIELYKEGEFNAIIASAIPNEGEYTWTVPENQEISSRYSVRITSTDDPSVYVEPVYYFTIKEPPPTVTYPKGLGIMWDQGKSYQITWSDFPGSNVSIELYKDGQLNMTIASSTPNDGEYTWTVPENQATSSKYFLNIVPENQAASSKYFLNTPISAQTIYAYPDYYFTIGKIKLIYPSGPDIIWDKGKSYAITWSGFSDPNVAIELYKDDQLNMTIASSASNDGEYAWTVPENQETSSRYHIRITSTDDPSVYVEPVYYLTIKEPPPTVTYPMRGVMWDQGKSYTITWSGFPGSNVNIELYKDGQLNMTIVSSTQNDGEYTWAVPENQATSSTYFLKITSTSDPSIYAYPDYYFTIGKIKLIYPSGPDITWDKGKSYTITWSGFPGSNVTIELYKDNQLNTAIASSASNDGEYTWTVPKNQEISSRYSVRITSTDDPSVYVEPVYYLIIKEPPPMITYPTRLDVMWNQGKSYMITWSDFPGSNVNIELYKDDQLSMTIASSTQNDGEYTWTVPENQAISSRYFLKITSTSDPSIYAYPSNYFTIGKIKLTYPSGTDIAWDKGKSYTITWSGFQGSNVIIELHKDNQFNTTIASSASNDGEYTWTVPTNQEISSGYSVRVTSSSDPSVYVEEPDYYLTIKEPSPTVTYPRGFGVMWDQGKSYQITWRDFPGSNVSIELYREDQLNVTIASSTPNDGEYIWTVPNDQAISSKYSIKIASTSDPSIFATGLIKFSINVTSDNSFSINVTSDNSLTPGLPVSGTYDIYFTIGKIKVTYPSGFDIVWDRGKDYTITWSGFPGLYVNIELYKEGEFNTTIASAIPNEGEYTWTVPDNQETSSRYSVKITSSSDPSVYSYSDFLFQIIEPSPLVVFPNGPGITMDQGRSCLITWSDFPGLDVRIELYKDGKLDTTIVSSAPNSGMYSWTIPANQAIGANYSIKIISVSEPSVYALSNFPFMIGRMMVIYPSGPNIAWYRGKAYQIVWDGFPGSNVNIELYKEGEFKRTLASSTPNDGEYIWTVPDDQEINSRYSIKVISTSGSSVYAASDYSFVIDELHPTVTYPNAPGIRWDQGKSYPITWIDFPGSNVRIELYKDGELSTIASSTPNDGEYTWTVPENQATSSGYYIKITSASDSSLFCFSNNYFTIGKIRVIYPLGPGTTWYKGKNYIITWRGFPGSTIKIELFDDVGINFSYPGVQTNMPFTINVSTIASSTPNDGEYSWTVPKDLVTSSYYFIKITSSFDSSIYAASDYYFIIDEPHPTVTYPDTEGLVWDRGESYKISWSDFPGSYVDIELHKDGQFNTMIASSTLNNGEYTWTVPNNQKMGGGYSIKIVSTSDPLAYNFSNIQFTIGKMKVTYPSDPEIMWDQGSSYTITWSGFPGQYVNIALYNYDRFDLYNYDRFDTLIASSTPNDGEYTWTVPLDKITSSKYIVKIESTSDKSVYGISDSYFTIGKLKVTYPSDSGITWYQGNSYKITWKDFPGLYVRIELYNEDGPYTIIAPSADNNGGYTWIIPDNMETGSKYRIITVSTFNEGINDGSDHWFTIDRNPEIIETTIPISLYKGLNLYYFPEIAGKPNTVPDNVVEEPIYYYDPERVAWYFCDPDDLTQRACHYYDPYAKTWQAEVNCPNFQYESTVRSHTFNALNVSSKGILYLDLEHITLPVLYLRGFLNPQYQEKEDGTRPIEYIDTDLFNPNEFKPYIPAKEVLNNLVRIEAITGQDKITGKNNSTYRFFGKIAGDNKMSLKPDAVYVVHKKKE